MKDIDNEHDILLEEDDEFDYEESHMPKLLTNDDIKKMKEED